MRYQKASEKYHQIYLVSPSYINLKHDKTQTIHLQNIHGHNVCKKKQFSIISFFFFKLKI